MKSVMAGEDFSSTWLEARAKFREAASAAGARLAALKYEPLDTLPAVWRSLGPDVPLTIDIALLGDELSAPAMLLHTSGVHGVEGFAGSAIQVGFLRDVAARGGWHRRGVCAVVVHGINAHGMAQMRRWNERGVDLNRNFLIEDVTVGTLPGPDGARATFSALAAQPHAVYRQIYDFVNPQSPAALLAPLRFYALAALAVVRHGFGALKQAIAGGNYLPDETPSSAAPALFFGGRELEQSHRLLAQFMRRLGERRVAPLRRVVHVDVHTGLGPWGKDTLLAIDRDADPSAVSRVSDARDALHERAPSRSGERSSPRACDFALEVSADSRAGGTAYALYGTLVEGLVQVLHAAAGARVERAACIVQEFGTEHALAVLEALRAERALVKQAEMAGEPVPSANHPLRRRLRLAFFPDDDEWRRAVHARGQLLIEQVCGWLEL